MATVNFYLKKEKEKETPVILYFCYHNQTLKYSTGVKVSLKDWDKDKSSPLVQRSLRERGGERGIRVL